MSKRPAATTVAKFLAQLPPERRNELAQVRAVVCKHLPAGYRETLASPKGYLALHLMAAYGSAELTRRLTDGFRAAGKKLDMGKACIRFRSADDLALDVIGSVVASVPVARFVAIAQAARRR